MLLKIKEEIIKQDLFFEMGLKQEENRQMLLLIIKLTKYKKVRLLCKKIKSVDGNKQKRLKVIKI